MAWTRRLREMVPARSVCLVACLLTSLTLAVVACGADGSPEASQENTSTTAAPAIPSASAVPTTAAASGTPAASGTSAAAPTTSTAAPTTPEADGSQAPVPTVIITVFFDNTVAVEGCRSSHGFSCLVEGLEKTVLFDTGADGGILLSNMEVLGVDPDDIDVVVLSHDHSDHTNGLARVVGANPDVTVYYSSSFDRSTIVPATQAGASLAPVDEATSICTGLTFTKPTGNPREAGLLVDTAEGPVLVLGCAHPGVVEMTAAATELAGRPVHAVLGGFHLSSSSAAKVDQVVRGLMELGVERCGPAHCTGEAAIAQIGEAFGAGAISMGVGACIVF